MLYKTIDIIVKDREDGEEIGKNTSYPDLAARDVHVRRRRGSRASSCHAGLLVELPVH